MRAHTRLSRAHLVVPFLLYRLDAYQDAEEGVPNTLGEHEFADQVCRYTSAWKDLTGEKVASASLWFADAGVRFGVKQARAE